MTSEPTKGCRRCGEAKPPDAFYKNATYLDGRFPRCIACCLVSGMGAGIARRRAFGPVPDGHACPVCARVTDDWHLDHDHDTGETRDYLCRGCNTNMDRYVGPHPLAEATAAYLRLHAPAI